MGKFNLKACQSRPLGEAQAKLNDPLPPPIWTHVGRSWKPQPQATGFTNGLHVEVAPSGMTRWGHSWDRPGRWRRWGKEWRWGWETGSWHHLTVPKGLSWLFSVFVMIIHLNTPLQIWYFTVEAIILSSALIYVCVNFVPRCSSLWAVSSTQPRGRASSDQLDTSDYYQNNSDFFFLVFFFFLNCLPH